jgi:hypothetical protein
MIAPVADPSSVGILLVDAQQPFLDWMHGSKEPLLIRLKRLLMLAGWLKLPLIATFESPVETKGWLPERLERAFPQHGQRFVKKTFNCCSETSLVEAIKRLGIGQIAVAGAETDVCILQSTLGLMKLGLQVFLLEDCVFTSEPHARPALERMYRAGVIPSTLKTFYYELMHTIDEEALALFHDKEFQVEKLPPWEPAS